MEKISHIHGSQPRLPYPGQLEKVWPVTRSSLTTTQTGIYSFAYKSLIPSKARGLGGGCKKQMKNEQDGEVAERGTKAKTNESIGRNREQRFWTLMQYVACACSETLLVESRGNSPRFITSSIEPCSSSPTSIPLLSPPPLHQPYGFCGR